MASIKAQAGATLHAAERFQWIDRQFAGFDFGNGVISFDPERLLGSNWLSEWTICQV